MMRFAKCLLFILLGLFYRVEIINKKNVPLKGPALLCSNHTGELDMFFIGYRIKRTIHWMAKEELFKNIFVSLLLKSLGVFPVKRGKADVDSIKTAFKLIKNGHIVGIFPEGTRLRKNEERFSKIKSGAAMIAVKTGAPILPVAIKGDYYRPFSKITVVFGEMFNVETEKEKKYSGKEMLDISRNIMKKVYGLLEE